MSSCYTTVTASVVQIAATGALGRMLNTLKAREVDIFASSYFTTKAFAHGFERDAHEEQEVQEEQAGELEGELEGVRVRVRVRVLVHARARVRVPLPVHAACPQAVAQHA